MWRIVTKRSHRKRRNATGKDAGVQLPETPADGTPRGPAQIVKHDPEASDDAPILEREDLSTNSCSSGPDLYDSDYFFEAPAIDEDTLQRLANGHSDVHDALQACKDRRILAAQRHISSLCAREGFNLTDLAPHAHVLGLDVLKVEEQAILVLETLSGLRDETGWATALDAEFRILHRHCAGANYQSLKFEGILPAPVEHVIAMAIEYDLTSTWHAYVRDTVVLAAQHTEAWVYGAMVTPLLLQFDVLVQSQGFDIIEEDSSFLVVLSDVAEEALPDGAKPVPHSTGYRRRTSLGRGSCMRFQPLPPGPDGQARTKATLLTHVDPRLPLIPRPLINFVLQVLGPFGYRIICQVLLNSFRDAGNVFPTRLAAAADFYGHIRRRAQSIPAPL